ncbi:MAG: type II secretion system F family protein [Chloroflexota bacterium]|nr:type II secretion system F family protein [Chloroflexota bacterium]
MNQNTLVITLIAISFLSLLGLVLVVIWLRKRSDTSKKEGRIIRFVAPSIEDEKPDHDKESLTSAEKFIDKFRSWINNAMSSLSSEKLKLKLSSAYWPITDAEFILIRVSATVLGLVFGWFVLGNILVGIFLAAIAILVPPILLDRAIAQRQKKFHDQLLDVLVLINGAVQAGYSLLQALDVAVKEISAPASEEFGRILHEMRLGITLETALNNLADRMENDDLQIVVTAVIINSQVGGSLSTVLDAAISTIRDRMQLMSEIRSLTSYSRYVGNFLTLMPFVAGLLIYMMSPSHFDTVKTSLVVQIIFGVALVGVVIGNIWVRQLVKIKV